MSPFSHLITAFRGEAIADKQIDELIGICKGVMADGTITTQEAEFILAWMNNNRRAAELWPAKVLYPRLVEFLADGNLDLNEERELLDLLLKTVGGNTASQFGAPSNSTALPLTKPSPAVIFQNRSFCFTGVFSSGTRDWCQRQVEARGGKSHGSITKKLDYLVIGDIGNENWVHSTHGRKIEKAVEYVGDGCSIHIVNEEYWHSHL